MQLFSVIHIFKRIVLDCPFLSKYSSYLDLFCLKRVSRLCDYRCHGSVSYIYTTRITVLRFAWYHLVFTQYSYYRDFFCFGSAWPLCNRHLDVWGRNIEYSKFTVACMSYLLLYIDLLRYCYFIMFYFKLTNGAMEKLWMVKWCNCEIKISIGHGFSHKYRICSFFLTLNTTLFQ